MDGRVTGAIQKNERYSMPSKSTYAQQLIAKQKIKKQYGKITETQFKLNYKEALRAKGDTVENMIGLLESRLDAAVYRLKLAPTIHAARQLISHKHIKVNGRKVNIPSYKLSVGDEIEIDQKMQGNENTQAALAAMDRDVPDYFEVDAKGFKGKYTRIPKLEDVPYPETMEPNLVIEFYSR